jgi:hypothetical protein
MPIKYYLIIIFSVITFSCSEKKEKNSNDDIDEVVRPTHLQKSDTVFYKEKNNLNSSAISFIESRQIIFNDSLSKMYTQLMTSRRLDKRCNMETDIGKPLYFSIHDKILSINYFFINPPKNRFIPKDIKFANDTLFLNFRAVETNENTFAYTFHNYTWFFKIRSNYPKNLKCILAK